MDAASEANTNDFQGLTGTDKRNPGRDRDLPVEGDIRKAVAARLGAVLAGMPQAQLAAKSGVSQTTISEYSRALRDPKLSQLEKIARASGRSLRWLATGDGPETLAAPSPSPEGFVLVPILPEAVSAGAGAAVEANDLEPERHVSFRSEWMRRIGVNPKRAHVLRVRGDSMEPTLFDGDVVLVDLDDTHPAGGGLYVINWAGEAVVKRLDRDFDGALVVISDARDRYQPKRVEAHMADQVRIIGRVRWFARTL